MRPEGDSNGSESPYLLLDGPSGILTAARDVICWIGAHLELISSK